MEIGVIVSIVGLLFGTVMTALIGLILLPVNRRKLMAETKTQLATAEESRIKAQGELQTQINELVKENERLRETRGKEYEQREKEREAKRNELNNLHDQLSNFQRQYIQITDELRVQRDANTNNLVKMGDFIIQREQDSNTIRMLKEEVLRLSKVTGKLEMQSNK